MIVVAVVVVAVTVVALVILLLLLLPLLLFLLFSWPCNHCCRCFYYGNADADVVTGSKI